MEDGFGATVRVILNSLAFFLLLILGGFMIQYNPLWGFLVLFSAVDQVEDVYYYVTRNRLIPSWFRPIDLLLEGVLAIIGVSMFLFGMVYWYSFDSWFFALWMIVSAMIAWSAVEDIVDDIHIMSEMLKGVPVASIDSHTRFRFFKRR